MTRKHYPDTRTAEERREYRREYAGRDHVKAAHAEWQRRPHVAKKINEKQRQARRENPEKARQWDKTWLTAKRMRSLGSTVLQYIACLYFQDNCCSICRRRFEDIAPRKGANGATWNTRVIEHCHATNTFRGVVCHNCNTLLGHAKDNPITLQSAVAYLDRARRTSTR